jgi:hypothetical protein
MNRILILIILTFITVDAFSSYVKGVVRDENNEALPFSSVYIKNSTYGTAANINGKYFLEVKPGKYTLVFSFIGYETLEKEINITYNKPLVLDVVLKRSPGMINEVEIVADKKDRAKMIMQKVRENRKKYLDAVDNYKCITYLKTSIEKELIKPEKNDSIKKDSTKKAKDISQHFKKERLNMIESFSETNFSKPSKYKEIIKAHHDYAEVRGEGGKSVTLGLEFGEENIIPETKFEDNPYILYNDVASADFNFYKNLIVFSAISQQPFQSPIATGSSLNYSYRFAGSFYENGKKINKIDVKPLYKTEALFSGAIYIEDSTWALVSVDLSVNKAAIQFCKDFKIIQNYEFIDNKYYMPVRREISYTIKDGKHNILGNTRVDHSDYKINTDFPPKFFNNEVKIFDVNAFDKDSTFWNDTRPIMLKEKELEFIHKTDSIKTYYTSDEYYEKIDSSFNRIDGWFWLKGIGHRYRKTGIEYYVSGIIEQVNPFGIGGYRHKLPAYINKEFKNKMLLETKGFIDYGFRNEDIKGKLGIGLTYIPLKFVRTFITIGDYYDQINNYASIEQTFSRSNYVRTKDFSIAQRMEITNGLFGELTFEYSFKDPIYDLQLSDWSELIFGELNTPDEFEPYKKAEVKLELKYRYKQEYLIKDGKKIILGSDYPELRFIYRKGIHNIFESEVDFDYIEFGAKDNVQLARFGSSSWEIQFGTFANRNNLRVLEHKYFRGSDRFFFSDPIRSFQLLGPTLNTRNEFFRANYLHHFEGSILNKIPVFNRLKLSLAGGAGALIINDQDFAHVEMYAGVEKIFRIKKQLFRLSVYAVTADNSLNKADFTIKFGLSFYNTFTDKWDY